MKDFTEELVIVSTTALVAGWVDTHSIPTAIENAIFMPLGYWVGKLVFEGIRKVFTKK